MVKLLKVGNQPNIPTKQYYVEKVEDLNTITDATVGSTALLLNSTGLTVYMMNAQGVWIKI